MRDYSKNPPCSIAGCEKPRRARGYCTTHWAQWRRHGSILERTFRDLNQIIIRGEVSEMLLYKGTTAEVMAKTLFDTEDIQKVNRFKWQITTDGYVRNRGKQVSFQEVVMCAKWVDHINGNRLDNRKSNLRKATVQQNNWNMAKTSKPRTTRYKGVSICKMTRKPYRVVLKADYTFIHVGRFEDVEEAAWMYDQFALSLFGEYAKTNFEYV